MITKKFLRTVGLICFIPSFFAVLGLITLLTLPEPVVINTPIRVAIVIGIFAFSYYLMIWMFMMFSDKTLWATRKELEDAKKRANKAEETYIKMAKKLEKKLVEECSKE